VGCTVLASAALAEDQAFDCVMDPSLRVNVGSSIPGLLDAVLVQRGDRVHAGQVIARLVSDVEVAQVALDRLRAASTAEIEARQAQLTLTHRQLDRTQELFQHQVATAEKLDELRAQAEINDRELRLAQQAQEVTKMELLRSEAYLRQREIRSPIDGLVTERLMTGGEYVHQEAIILKLARLDPTRRTDWWQHSGAGGGCGPGIRCRQRQFWRTAGTGQRRRASPGR
jgi:RND family efflux transporter MFP subunit